MNYNAENITEEVVQSRRFFIIVNVYVNCLFEMIADILNYD